jgi:hypothetical protein
MPSRRISSAPASRLASQCSQEFQRPAGNEFWIEDGDMLKVFVVGHEMGRLAIQCREEESGIVSVAGIVAQVEETNGTRTPNCTSSAMNGMTSARGCPRSSSFSRYSSRMSSLMSQSKIPKSPACQDLGVGTGAGLRSFARETHVGVDHGPQHIRTG